MPDPTDSNERGLIAERMNVLADEVEVLTSSVMGITVGCARCHNHKYDPIPQRDYYRLSAILQGAYDPYEWKGPKKRELDLAPRRSAKSVAEQNAPLQAEIKRTSAADPRAAEPFRAQAVDEAIAALPAEVRDEVACRGSGSPPTNARAQRALAEKYKRRTCVLRSGAGDANIPSCARKTQAHAERIWDRARETAAAAARSRAGR